MKKLFFIFGILLLSGLHFSCEKDQETISSQEMINIGDEGLYNSEKVVGVQTTCGIVSPSSINATTTEICLNTTYTTETFTYQSNLSNPSVSWNIPSVPGLSVIGSSNTPTITLQFASNFNGATIQANGVSGTISCDELEVITVGCGGNVCNDASDFDFESYYICQQNKGFLYNIYGNLDPTTITKIYVNLKTCGVFTNNAGTLQGSNRGFIYPSTVRTPMLFNGCSAPRQDCIPGTSYNVELTYYFNNGCPTYSLTKNFQFDYIP